MSTIYTNTYTNAVKVTWNIPDNTSNLNGYYVYIKDTQHSTTINDIVNNTLIDGLESFTTYVTCVVPLLLDGTGNELCTEFTTKQEGEYRVCLCSDTPLQRSVYCIAIIPIHGTYIVE